MAAGKCPLCESPCIIKIIATGNERFKEVDVCKACGAMYPREGALSAKSLSYKRPRGKKVKAKARRPSRAKKAPPEKRKKRTKRKKRRARKASRPRNR